MSPPANRLLSNRLNAMLQESTSLDALALVSMDGLEIASALPEGINSGRMAAMTLASYALGEQIARELDRKKLQEVYVRGKDGFTVLLPINNKAILIALSRQGSRPGVVLLEMRRVASELLKPAGSKPARF